MLVATTAGRYGTNKVVLKKGTNVAGTYNRKSAAVNPLSKMLQPVQVQQVDQDSLEERSAFDDESESCFKGG